MILTWNTIPKDSNMEYKYKTNMDPFCMLNKLWSYMMFIKFCMNDVIFKPIMFLSLIQYPQKSIKIFIKDICHQHYTLISCQHAICF